MNYIYKKIVGIGGLGYGMLFCTDDNRTLGRSESRMAFLSTAKDYCKQHIVLYYVAALLSPEVSVIPIGYVGKDANGERLIKELQQDRMDTTYISKDDYLPTMFGVCLQYPDKEGCNITASNSACNLVTPEYVVNCMNKIGIDKQTIVAAIPEVQAESRIEMLKFGKEKGAFCVMSVTEAEAAFFLDAKVFTCCDLLAVNEMEALALLSDNSDRNRLAERLYKMLIQYNPNIMLLVTVGKHGAYTGYRGRIEYIPSMPANVVNTTGAGDAFLGGTIAGLTMGLPFQKGYNDDFFGQTPLNSAPELGALCAGMAIESEDSIARHVVKESIKARILQSGWLTGEHFIK